MPIQTISWNVLTCAASTTIIQAEDKSYTTPPRWSSHQKVTQAIALRKCEPHKGDSSLEVYLKMLQQAFQVTSTDIINLWTLSNKAYENVVLIMLFIFDPMSK